MPRSPRRSTISTKVPPRSPGLSLPPDSHIPNGRCQRCTKHTGRERLPKPTAPRLGECASGALGTLFRFRHVKLVHARRIFTFTSVNAAYGGGTVLSGELKMR